MKIKTKTEERKGIFFPTTGRYKKKVGAKNYFSHLGNIKEPIGNLRRPNEDEADMLTMTAQKVNKIAVSLMI